MHGIAYDGGVLGFSSASRSAAPSPLPALAAQGYLVTDIRSRFYETHSRPCAGHLPSPRR